MDCPMNASRRHLLSAASGVFACVLVLVTVFYCVGGPEGGQSWQAQRARRTLMAEGESAKQNRLYSDALAAFQKALALTDKEKDPKSWTVTASSVADMHSYLGPWKEAKRLYTEILSLRKKHYGPTARETAETLTSLVLLLTDRNRVAEAEELLDRTLARNKGFYSKHIEKVAAMRHALAMSKARLGERYPYFVLDLDNTSGLLEDKGRMEEAEARMRLFLASAEAASFKNDPNITVHLNSLAQLLKDKGRLTEAEALMRRMVAISVDFTVKSGETSPYLWSATRNYRSLLVTMGCTEAQVKERIGKLMEPIVKK